MHRTEGANNIDGSFVSGPPPTTVPPEWLNAVQEEISNVIEKSGLQLYPADTDPLDQLWKAMQKGVSAYDIVVTSQSQFNDIIERVAINQYKIKSEYTSVYVKAITGGYACAGVNSFLSDGDTWGYIETNACSHLEFQNGTYLNFSTGAGYIKVNTSKGLLKNIDIQGSVVSAVITRSFLLAATYVTFDNCSTSIRTSSGGFDGFEGSGTALHNLTSKYVNCVVHTIAGTATDIHGFFNCMNLTNCIVYSFSAAAAIHGFKTCTQLAACVVYDLTSSSTATGFEDCDRISSCYAYTITSTGSTANGFTSCDQVSACYAFVINASGSSLGFSSCVQVSACKVRAVDSSGGTATGYNNCDQISACYVEDVDAAAGDAYGFRNCNPIAACHATDIDASGVAEGFGACSYGAALFTDEATNSGNDWIDSTDAQIVNKVSTPDVWT